jgi:hypothetical protein
MAPHLGIVMMHLRPSDPFVWHASPGKRPPTKLQALPPGQARCPCSGITSAFAQRVTGLIEVNNRNDALNKKAASEFAPQVFRLPTAITMLIATMKAATILSVLLFAWIIQAADTKPIPNFRADLCRTPWTWVNSTNVVFLQSGKATIGADTATGYAWKIKSQEKRIVEVTWTYAGAKRNAVFTFAEDMKSAKAMMDGKREWESKPVAK